MDFQNIYLGKLRMPIMCGPDDHSAAFIDIFLYVYRLAAHSLHVPDPHSCASQYNHRAILHLPDDRNKDEFYKTTKKEAR